MDEDALMAFGAVLTIIGGLLERAGISSNAELAGMLRNMAAATDLSGPQYSGQAAYVTAWSSMVQSAAMPLPEEGGKPN
jgi:hypothetical protein